MVAYNDKLLSGKKYLSIYSEFVPENIANDIKGDLDVIGEDRNPLSQMFAMVDLMNPADVKFLDDYIGNRNDAIFYLECSKTYEFTSVQWCAIESAAYHYPEKKIVVMFLFYDFYKTTQNLIKRDKIYKTTKIKDQNQKYEISKDLSKTIFNTYKNVHFVSLLNIDPFLETTEFAGHQSELEAAPYSGNAYSNIVRLIFIHRYGGIYSDMDVITIDTLPEGFPQNFLASASHNSSSRCFINNHFFRFTKEHPFLKLLIKRIASHFNAYIWGYNGCFRITETIKECCINNFKDHSLSYWSHKPFSYCQSNDTYNDFVILNQNIAQVIEWQETPVLTNADKMKSWLKIRNATTFNNYFEKSGTVIVHLSNKITHGWFDPLTFDRSLPFHSIFKNNCPKAYSNYYP